MPFLTYSTVDEALANAGRFLQEAGAQAVKVEGGVRSARIIEALVKAGIPVMGHIGWTPQAQLGMGGKVKVQGKDRTQARGLLADALAVQEAGAFSIVLELMPAQLAAAITERLASRPSASGPVPAAAARSRSSRTCSDSVTSSRATPGRTPRCATTIGQAARAYAADVAAGTFPGEAETVRMDEAVLDEALGRGEPDRASGSSRSVASRSTATSRSRAAVTAVGRPRSFARGPSCAPRSPRRRGRSGSCRRWAGCTRATGP